MSETSPVSPEKNDLAVSSVPGQTPQPPHAPADEAAPRPTAQPQQNPPDPSAQNTSPALENQPLETADLQAFTQLAGELKLTDAQTEKLAAFAQARVHARQQQQLEEKHQQAAAWAGQTRALYGAGLEQELTFALRAANTFGGPELRELLEQTGLGNHPVIIRTLSGIGRTISEDACPGGTPAAPQDKTFAEALYGKRN